MLKSLVNLYNNLQNLTHTTEKYKGFRTISYMNMESFYRCLKNYIWIWFKVQGFFICHIIVIQGITRSEMQSNQVRSVTVQNNKNTNYISNITQGHTYGKKRRNKNKMCNEIKKCKTIRCAKNNKMCKRQWDVQKTMRCAKKQQDVQKNNKMYKKRKQKTVYWDLINSNVNKRDVQTGCSWYCT